MTPPPGLTNRPNLVCRLIKSLYRLKQTSRQWFAKLSSFLTNTGFIQSKSNYSLFIRKTTNNFTSILVCVDDIILARSCLSEIKRIKEVLNVLSRSKTLENLSTYWD